MQGLTEEEKKKIFEEEKARLEAQEKLKRDRSRKRNIGCLSIIVILGLLLIIGHQLQKKEKPILKPPPKQIIKPTEEEEKMLKDLIEAKLVEKVNPELNEAWVDPVSWGLLKYDEKRNLARFLAIYCGKKKGTGLYWVNILDSYSGKKLANYSESWGFKVY